MIIAVPASKIIQTATTERHVQCEHCQNAFSYQLIRKQVNSAPLGTAWLVKRVAKRYLDAEMLRAIDPMSCPLCGWIQANMVRELRRRFLGFFRAVGTILVFACAGGYALAYVGAQYLQMDAKEIRDNGIAQFEHLCLAGILIGFTLPLLRLLLAKLAYPKAGYMPRTPLIGPQTPIVQAP